MACRVWGWLLAAAVPVGLFAGGFGTLVGIGGGAIMVPVMAALGAPLRVVVPASLLAILGTSLGGLRLLLRRGLVDPRLAVFLETGSTLGALVGVRLHLAAPEQLLRLLLGLVLLSSAPAMMLRSRLARVERSRTVAAGWRRRGALRLAAAWLASFLAGVISALLGVGGGVVKVPIMVLVLGLPVKVAVATSKLMVGITAAAGLLGYAAAGDVSPCLGAALLLGTYTGARLASRLLASMRPRRVAVLAAAYYTVMGVYLVYTALG